MPPIRQESIYTGIEQIRHMFETGIPTEMIIKSFPIDRINKGSCSIECYKEIPNPNVKLYKSDAQ